MARAAGNTFLGVLGVLLLLPERAQAARGDAPSVCYNFSINILEDPWCKFEGQVNGDTFLNYTCSQKAKCHFYPNTTRGSVTETCKEKEETLKDLTDKLKKILSTLKSKNPTISSFQTLKGKMTCQWEDNGRAYGSWFFYIDGAEPVPFDSRNENRTPLNSEDSLSNDILNNDEHLNDFLHRNSPNMCKRWPEKVWTHQGTTLNTAGSVTSEPTTEPPTSASATDQSKTMYICIIVGIILIIPGFCVFCIRRRRCCRRLVRQGAPSGGCVGQDVEASFLPTSEIPGEPSCSQSRDSQLPADWRERSPETLCLEQRPATQTGSPSRVVTKPVKRLEVSQIIKLKQQSKGLRGRTCDLRKCQYLCKKQERSGT